MGKGKNVTTAEKQNINKFSEWGNVRFEKYQKKL